MLCDKKVTMLYYVVNHFTNRAPPNNEQFNIDSLRRKVCVVVCID